MLRKPSEKSSKEREPWPPRRLETRSPQRIRTLSKKPRRRLPKRPRRRLQAERRNDSRILFKYPLLIL